MDMQLAQSFRTPFWDDVLLLVAILKILISFEKAWTFFFTVGSPKYVARPGPLYLLFVLKQN
jgi:hypothetical protein